MRDVNAPRKESVTIWTYRRYKRWQREKFEEFERNEREKFEKFERNQLGWAVTTTLVRALDCRDRYTAGHSAAVAIYARDIAERLGLTAQQQGFAHVCGLLHDIGKIGLPEGLIEKPGELTLEERRMYQEHAVIGERILAGTPHFEEITPVIRHHHERVDGQGYPDGLTVTRSPCSRESSRSLTLTRE